MKQLLRYCFVLCSLAFAGVAVAQDRTVSGKVSSSEDGSGLPGVSVVIKGTSVGTATDANGTYKLSVPANATKLVFSFVGFLTKEVDVGGLSALNVSLDPDTKMLSEVVVTGYGSQNKKEITGAVSSVKGDVIENLPMQSFDRALQGRAAGVLVQAANGVPGGQVRIRIRGTGSITAGNEPLYIVDGVQINNSSNADFVSSNPLGFLNPNDIESIEILKDAATASIYGAQAANGVVLVTTKKGKAGKTNFNLNYYYGSTSPVKYMNVLNSQDWIKVRTEAIRNQNPALSEAQARTSALTGIRLDGGLSDAQIAALPTYDWQRAAYKQGGVQNIELSANGGSDKTTFYISGSYNKQDANVINVDFERATLRMSVNHKVSNKLSFEQSINLSTISQKGTFGSPNGGSFLGSPYFASPLIIPTNPIYNEDGTYFGTPQAGGISGVLNQNILLTAETNTIRNVTNQAVGNFKLIWSIAEGLTFNSFFGLDYRVIKGEYYADPRTADGFAVRGRLTNENEQSMNFTTNHTLNYNKTFARDHKIGTILGVEYRNDVRESWNQQVTSFATPQFRTANGGATPQSASGFWTGYKRAGVFGRVNYDFKGRYLLTATLRYDGSSRFGANQKFGFFPGVSAGWVISEENFIKDKVSWLDEIKLRASYGATGNDQIGDFDSRGLTGGGFNYIGQAGIAPNQLSNPNLSWEKNVTTDIGIDLGFFNRRITATVDYFDRQSKQLLLNQPVAWTSGYGDITANVGQMYNRGWEFGINTTNLTIGDFTWKTNFNISLLENKVTKLVGSDTVLASNTSVRVGHPIGAVYTAEYAGVNPATGRPMWYDINGNPTYTPRNPTDFRVLGSSFATRFGGLTNTFAYKGLELLIFFQAEYGRKVANGQSSFLSENGGRLFNTLQEVYDRRWTTAGQLTDVPRPINGNAEVRGNGATGGSRFFEDASYIRLKQLSLSYNLPNKLISRAKLASVRVYAQATNLLTFTKWSGYDPEFLDTGAGNNGVVPQSRTYNFGINIGF
ncbi:MAG: TonB-dependent receptor [Cytophagales bacterium]|nr:MAG: TonB-dependent receptor [Cytophagales bacterium]